MLRALLALDEEERHVMAFALDGFAAAEIAPALDITEQRVQTVSARAREKLRETLAADLAHWHGTAPDPDSSLRRSPAGDQLGQLLAGASREILRHVADTVAMAGAYTEIMAQDSLRVPSSAASAPATVMIGMRIHARELASAIADACVRAHSARRSIRDRDSELAVAAASALSGVLGRAHELMQALGPEIDLKLDLDEDIRLAGILSRGGAVGWARASELAAALVSDLGGARMRAVDLARGLTALPADVSGADLSGTGIKDVGALDGVTWTCQTTWPTAIEDQVQARSREIRPGVYRIHIPYGSDSSG